MRATSGNQPPPIHFATRGGELRAQELFAFHEAVTGFMKELQGAREAVDAAIAAIAAVAGVQSGEDVDSELADLEEDKRQIEVFSQELFDIGAQFALRMGPGRTDYANALEGGLRMDRSALHRNYADAPIELDRWSARWHHMATSLEGKAGERETARLQRTELAQVVAALAAERKEMSRQRGVIREDVAAWASGFTDCPDPGDEPGQRQWVIIVRSVVDHAALAERRSQDLVTDAKAELARVADGKEPPQALKDSFRLALTEWLDDRNALAKAKAQFAGHIRDNMPGLSAAAVLELAWPPSARSELCAATTSPEVDEFATRHLAVMDALLREITEDGKTVDESFSTKWKAARARMERDCMVQNIAIKTEAQVANVRRNFPPHLQTPTRFPDAPRLGDRVYRDPAYDHLLELREASVRSADSDAAVRYHEAAEEYFGISNITEQLDDIVKAHDRRALDKVVERVSTGATASRMLVACPYIYLHVMGSFGNCYRQIESSEAYRELMADAGAAAQPGKPRKQEASKPSLPVSRTAAAYGSGETDSEPEVEEPASEPALASLYIADAKTLDGPGWIGAREPATWTRFKPRGSEHEIHLGEISQRCTEFASMLWNWSQLGTRNDLPPQGMGGDKTRQLNARECIALIDWVICSSRADAPSGERLFSRPFEILCGRGTEGFAGTDEAPNFQLKIVNDDPDAPTINGKRPTFHLNIDPAALNEVTAELALRKPA